eukprot:6119081-Amphidinium_carterae.1
MRAICPHVEPGGGAMWLCLEQNVQHAQMNAKCQKAQQNHSNQNDLMDELSGYELQTEIPLLNTQKTANETGHISLAEQQLL